ncbi:TIGR00341 family protein [Tautonia marina]|uniref:TIGR00341 family protein n=1 Tax=Tautonia marina TaxID=2653855 RepID=UPI001260AFE1|nr:TIGR00341 family protein [Tautonia marina]
MAILLLFDPAEEAKVRETIVPLFGEEVVEAIPYPSAELPEKEAGTRVVTFLGDEALAPVVQEAAKRGWRLGILPHPGLDRARSSLGIAPKLEEAVADLLDGQADEEKDLELDLLLCNGRVVFQDVVIGHALTLAPGSTPINGIWGRLKHFAGLVRDLTSLRLQPVQLVTQNENEIDTAALGIVAVEQGRSSLLARRIVDASSDNDGMLYAMVLAPRSLLQLLGYLVTSVVMGRWGGTRIPSFVGLVRASSLTIRSPKPLELAHDGVLLNAKQVELIVEPKALRLIAGHRLTLEPGSPESKERFQVQALPVGEAKGALMSKPLPWLSHASTEEFKELYSLLRDNARCSSSYLTLMVLSTLLATLGLYGDSAPVIIGAMILAPLMAPIIALAMGLVRQDFRLLGKSSGTLAAGLVLALGFAMVTTWFTPLRVVTDEISARMRPTLLDLGVAVISGIAGAYAHARAEVARSLAGVAIAVALVPPVAVAGIGIGWADWSVFGGASLLFLTNLTGIILASGATFLWLGFAPFRRARSGLLLELVLVAAVSVPLAFSFGRMVEEHRIIRELDGWEVGSIAVRSVDVRPGDPLQIGVTLVSRSALNDADLDRVKRAIEERIGQEVELVMSVAIMR